LTPLLRLRSLGVALAIAIYLLDQWLKARVAGPWGLDMEGESIRLLPFFNLTRANNLGVSLGMFQASSLEMRWGLVAVTGLIALVVFTWMMRERRGADIAALGLILGGAIGNIRDRYKFGYVIDYADLHFGGWQPFMIFNLADAAISVGVVIILARALFMREKPPGPHSDAAAPDPSETT
jgi:signal peptidase II